jgi:dienelactone hydrolase
VEPLRTPPGATRIDYTSGGMKLAAYVSAAPTDGTKRPGVLFLHGGFGFGDGDWEMAQPYRDAGYVVMLPTLRAENGQPGHFTLYFEEVDDVLAAADAFAALPYVDSGRLFVAGHSAGGSLATLAAMASNRFRGAASLGGCMDQRLNADIAPFDTKDDREFRIRSPLDFAGSFQCPARLYYGNTELLLADAIRRTATQAKQRGLDVEAVSVPGDHMTAAEPAIRQSLTFFLQRGGADPAAAKSPVPPTPSPKPASSAPRPATPQSPSPPQPPSLPPGFRPPPSPPGVPNVPGTKLPAGPGLSGSVVVFQVVQYSGSQDAAAAARQALAGMPWVDPSHIEYDAKAGTLTIGLRGSAVNTGPARTALQNAGFRIGTTSVRRTGQ